MRFMHQVLAALLPCLILSGGPALARGAGAFVSLQGDDAQLTAVEMRQFESFLARGYAYMGSGQFQSDRVSESVTASLPQTLGRTDSELTYTVVPRESEVRIGIDRDLDGALDRDELDQGTRPDDATSH